MIDIRTAWAAAITQLSKDNSPQEILTVGRAWKVATTALDAGLLARSRGQDIWNPAVLEAIELLQGVDVKLDLLQWYLESIQNAFKLVEDDVVAFVATTDVSNTNAGGELLTMIGMWLKIWQGTIDTFWPSDAMAYGALRTTFLNSLYPVLPDSFPKILTAYLRFLLHSPATIMDDPVTRSAVPMLVLMLDRFDPLLFGLIYEEIEAKVEMDCTGNFGEPKLEALGRWLSERVMSWVTGIYAHSMQGQQEEAKKMLKPTYTRFEYHIHKTLCVLRTKELFDIINDYPDSKPALEDLKLCLSQADQRTLLVNRLRSIMKQRLLHPGASTRDIITCYISTIRSLRLLDPQGVLLSRVADPIRIYLRSREDTIRCIVSSLIEEGNDLVAELVASDAKPVSDSREEAENYSDLKWSPDPVDAPLDFHKSKGSDIVQLLVSIYDTKDVFIKELQVLLAQRLLAIQDYVLDKEIKNVEILKIRFGEASLQGCEVMIKDLHDSKRIDHYVHEHNELPIHATIVSRLFWPSFQQHPLKLPGQLGRAKAAYEKSYIQLKPDKKLRWLPHLGTINLTIELKDRSITLDATPLQASIMELFGQKETWSIDSLDTTLRTNDPSAIRNSLYFWANKGVLKLSDNDTWVLLEEEDDSKEVVVAHVIEEEGPAVQSVESLQIEQMRVYWQYIQGMLTNMGPCPLSRMHSMLNMLVPTYKGKTTDELTAFLEVMQGEGLVEKGEKGWKIVR